MGKDWNQAYLTGECPWDKGAAAPPLRAYLEQSQITGTVLVPGCGLGHDVRLLAKAGAMVTGLDSAPKAIELAKGIGSLDRIDYQVGDFLAFNPALVEGYDWVFEHTCLCALEPKQRQNYVDALCRVLKPQADYLAIFYIQVENYDGLGPPHPITRREIDELFKSRFHILDARVPTESYSSRPYGCELLMHMQKRLGH